MTAHRTMDIRVGIIGCGLMGREFASAAGRWCHLSDVSFAPRVVAACDTNPETTAWFERHVPDVLVFDDYRDLIDSVEVDVVYCAVPHNLHENIYIDVMRAGKHLLGEKPFGIDLAANQAILHAMGDHPDVFVRCTSQFPFFPGAYQVAQWVSDGRFGRIIEVEAGFWHSSDLDPSKAINWKRQVETNGDYGCMGDLGMHVLHLPLRFGWQPANVRALLSNVVTARPDASGVTQPCETWDNAVLACEVKNDQHVFPMLLSTKRIAPGHANTWFINVYGTDFSARFSTKDPKRLEFLPYRAGDQQAWHVLDVAHRSAYPSITGEIFEFGFSDAILQMWAAFCDELVNGADMQQPLGCVTPQETAASHALFTAAIESQRTGQTIALD